MIAAGLPDPLAALVSGALTVVIVVLVVAGASIAWEWWRGGNEPVPGEDLISHVTVIPPARDWGAEVRAAHRVQQDATLASGDHIAVYDQDAAERGAA